MPVSSQLYTGCWQEAGWYLRQKPVGESKAAAGGLSTLPFPLSLPSHFHSPYISDKPVGGKVISSEGEVPRLPPYKYHPDRK